MKGSFKIALIAAVVSAVVAAGAAVATTQAFTLGTTNRVDAVTKVTNVKEDGTQTPITGPMMFLEDKSSTTGATALWLQVAPGRPPLGVNSKAGTATNLSADKLDGIDSTGFVGGPGSVVSNRVTALPWLGAVDIVTAGPYRVGVVCPVGGNYQVRLTNTGQAPSDYWASNGTQSTGGVLTTGMTGAIGSTGEWSMVTLRAASGFGAGQTQTATIAVSVHWGHDLNGNDVCYTAAQAVVQP